MKISDFDYYLPPAYIAQEPATPRDSARLMVVDRKTQQISPTIFRKIGNFLNKGDLLVINDAKVFPARLLGRKKVTGGKIDLLLVEKESEDRWRCLIQGAGKIRPPLEIVFGEGKLTGTVEDYDSGIYRVRFDYEGNFRDILEEIGEPPLPPYIRKPTMQAKERYQTVYAEKEGAIAAPTAGFHFTKELLFTLKDKGVEIAAITLKVGRGTFIPVKVENVEEHRMEEESFEIRKEEGEKINRQLAKKGRIIAVGTTTVRALESAFENGKIKYTSDKTSLFIYPGYKFKIVNSLITNFHLPKSTPLLLTCAFAGKDLIMKVYKEAIEKKYRFYSFGDAMLIL